MHTSHTKRLLRDPSGSLIISMRQGDRSLQSPKSRYEQVPCSLFRSLHRHCDGRVCRSSAPCQESARGCPGLPVMHRTRETAASRSPAKSPHSAEPPPPEVRRPCNQARVGLTRRLLGTAHRYAALEALGRNLSVDPLPIRCRVSHCGTAIGLCIDGLDTHHDGTGTGGCGFGCRISLPRATATSSAI